MTSRGKATFGLLMTRKLRGIHGIRTDSGIGFTTRAWDTSGFPATTGVIRLINAVFGTSMTALDGDGLQAEVAVRSGADMVMDSTVEDMAEGALVASSCSVLFLRDITRRVGQFRVRFILFQDLSMEFLLVLP